MSHQHPPAPLAPPTSPPPRWAAPRERVIYGVNHMARRAVRDVLREARKDLRDRHLPVDPWMDACIAGRSGNHCADFLVRMSRVLSTAGECPHKIRARLQDLAHRIADAVQRAPRHA
ncbi:MAG: hypothetical protein K2Y26_17900 [Gemmatimonadaceae bacterium]|nr:hypothetical protein [Gemmatimonadaceae bacterium]